MATNRSGHRPAGGIASRVNVEKPVRTGKGSTGIRPGYTNKPGSMYGDHVTNRDATGYRGPKREEGKNFQPVKFGNEVALNVGKGGCGTGRTIHDRGSQQQWGDPAQGNPPPQRNSFD
jgi:hypothetical protein